MAGEVVDKVQETASRLMGSEGGSASGAQGAPVMDQAAEQITSRLDVGKDYVAETVTGMAKALRQSGRHLREEGSPPMLAQYAETGASQVERFGEYLRQHDTNAIVTDVEAFARRQPMVFAGSAFALGMLAVRFLKSGGQSQGQPSSSSTWSNGGGSNPVTSQSSGFVGASGSTAAPSGGTRGGPGAGTTHPAARPAGGLTGPGSPAGTGSSTPSQASSSPYGETPINTGASTGTTSPTPGAAARPNSDTSTSAQTGTGRGTQP
jgi:hypothetical protein